MEGGPLNTVSVRLILAKRIKLVLWIWWMMLPGEPYP